MSRFFLISDTNFCHLFFISVPRVTMSLTIILIYIIISIFIFISYTPKPKKVLENFKLFLNEVTHRKENNNATNKTVWNIPGPKSLPFFGTKWLHLTGTYKLNKIHEMFQGKIISFDRLIISLFTIVRVSSRMGYVGA